ncbi:MAG: hypothetical protein M3004_10800 [Bacteroidota bacterium]|nr:hypothetical protein [Bacteroidota bacterium]
MKFFLLVVTVIFFISCKDDTSLPNNKSSVSNWSKTYRNKFLSNCINKVAQKMKAADAFNFCRCITEKEEEKFPDEHDADIKFTEADLKDGCTTADANTLSDNQSRKTSNKSEWSATDQKEFMDNCVPHVSEGLGANAAGYCNCILNKIMIEYPDPKDAGSIPKNKINLLATDCFDDIKK